MAPHIEVLVINCNGLSHLDTCLGSLRASAYPDFRVVLLDNGSTDGSVPYTQAHFPDVEIVGFDSNRGFSGGYDTLIRSRSCEFLVLLNNDTEVHPNWLEPLTKAILSADDIALAGAKLLSFQQRSQVDHAGGKINPLGGGIDKGKGQPDHPAPHLRDSYELTGFACGGAMMFRRSAYIALGGFDPSYIIYHEDVDLAWKAWLAGWRVVHVPESIVYHKGGAFSGAMETPHRLFLSQRNRWRNLLKNAGWPKLLTGTLCAAGFDLARLARFLILGEWNKAYSLAKANLDVIRELPVLQVKRDRVQALRRRSDHELERLGVFISLKKSLHEYLFLTSGPRKGG